jgi:endonuclease YncB( thermonuclease family)
MPLNLVKGTFRILHSAPDGDSVHFYPDDREAFTKLNLAALPNHEGGVQLRLDAIDALETHYTPRVHGGFTHHQPLGLAHAAGDELLELLGFSGVARDHEKVTAATPERVPGWILTRFADKYGRPVSLVFAGEPEQADLSAVFVNVALLQRSMNHQLLAAGLVYPTFYSQLFVDLRRALTATTHQAREAGLGVWAQDSTTAGAAIANLTDVDDKLVLLPKLFRRLIDYFALGAGSASLDGFEEFLAARDDRVLVLPDGQLTGLDTVVQVEGQTVRLLHPPEDVVFLEG